MRERHLSTSGDANRSLQFPCSAYSSGRSSWRRPRISDSDRRSFLEELVPDPPDSRPGQTRAANLCDGINAIYRGRYFGQADVRGNAWGAWQAVVAYNDHAMTSRKTRTSTAEETRFERILSGQNIGSRAPALL